MLTYSCQHVPAQCVQYTRYIHQYQLKSRTSTIGMCPAASCAAVRARSPALNKWRMEVLTRSAGGTVFHYAHYQEGAEPVFYSFPNRQPVRLGADQLILGVDK